MITQENARVEYHEDTYVVILSEGIVDIKETLGSSFIRKANFITFSGCDFRCLNLESGNENKLQNISFTICKVNNSNLVEFLNQNLFSNLLTLSLQSSEICNIEDIVHCLVNIKNMESIYLNNNKIRSIKPIIKLNNSKCKIFIHQTSSYMRHKDHYKSMLRSISQNSKQQQLRYTHDNEEYGHSKNYIINPESFRRTNLAIIDDLPLYHCVKLNLNIV